VPSIDTFCEQCRLVFWTCIHVWVPCLGYLSYKAGQQRHTWHLREDKRVVPEGARGWRAYIAMHGVQMMSETGLLPPCWLQTYAAFNHAGRVYGQLVLQFGLGKNRTEARKAMKKLKAGLVEKLGHAINELIIESLACKAVQRDTTRRGRPVYDVHHRRAPLVQRREDGNGLSISMSDTELMDLECGSLMSRWPYRDDILSMGDIYKQLGMEVSIEATYIEVSVHHTFPEEA
jgi:hypothetical protein